MAPVIVPRWEWRCFGEHFGEVESVFAALSPQEVVESNELYLLSVKGVEPVKVRDELMDVKHLQQVDDAGVERWVPVMKAAFPLSAADVGAVLAALHVDAPAPLTRATYSLAELLEEVMDPSPDVRAVRVFKRRRRYTIGGCAAELTDVRTGQASTRTIAIESEDATSVIAAVRELGLAPRPNVSFARGLKVLSRFGAERFAVVDVGTNSVKFHIGERSGDGLWQSIVDRAEITRLGDGLQQAGRLSPEPMARTVEAIATMAEEARRHRVAAIAAVGTAGLRMAANSEDFVNAVQARCGVLVKTVSGEEEGRLAYQAATAGLGSRGSRVVFDTGGGSTQFTFGDGGRVDERFSVEVGAVRFTEEYGLSGAVSRDVLTAALDAIGAGLARLDGRASPDTLVGMGGAITNLAAVKHGLTEYDPDIVQGTVLERTEIDRQIEIYRTRGIDQRRTLVGLQPRRADVILAGACIVRTVLDKLGRDSLVVSDRGLRHGVLAEEFG
jgi:exopolyphosphatase/guanosine-5'-triphosphate,3'-diphosphate pyrophosphatase